MSEWFDGINTPPPKDGTWIIAACSDFSGLSILSFSDGWIDASGDGDLFEDDEFGFYYSVWTLLPSWFRPWAQQQWIKEEKKKRYSGGIS